MEWRLRPCVDADADWILELRAAVGCVAVRHAPDAHWIEHFYLDPALQGRGIGTAVLRHAFVVERDGPVEVLMVRAAPQT